MLLLSPSPPPHHHFIDRETEARGGYITCLRLGEVIVAELKFVPVYPGLAPDSTPLSTNQATSPVFTDTFIVLVTVLFKICNFLDLYKGDDKNPQLF